jgi:hypothetical protein
VAFSAFLDTCVLCPAYLCDTLCSGSLRLTATESSATYVLLHTR